MRVRGLVALVAFGVTGCGDDPVAPELNDERRRLAETFVVSEPTLPITSANPTVGLLRSVVSTDERLAYVSLPANSVQEGLSVAITNRRTGIVRSAPIVDGGLDPVPIPAIVGDTLGLLVARSAGEAIPLERVVLARVPPRVIRTRPAGGARAVPLSTTVVAVFSEPIDQRTTTIGTVQLTRLGQRIPGRIVVGPDALSVDFVPDNDLTPSTEYTLVISREVRDLVGDPLEAAVQVTFTTDLTSAGFIAFVMGQDVGPTDISVMRADGSGERNVTNNPGVDGAPSWSPDGSKIAFYSNRSGTLQIYVMNADGTNVVQVPTGISGYDPVWSPDGRRLAFIGQLSADVHSQVFISDPDGGNLLQVTDGPGNRSAPAWSPDGNRIAYSRVNTQGPSSGRSGNSNVWITDLSGAETNVTNFPENFDGLLCPYARNPQWSPDGGTILYMECTSTSGGEGISRMRPDGTDRRFLGPGSYAAWSPDGTAIVFVGTGAHSAAPATGIFIMPATSLTLSESARLIRPGVGTRPAWGR